MRNTSSVRDSLPGRVVNHKFSSLRDATTHVLEENAILLSERRSLQKALDILPSSAIIKRRLLASLFQHAYTIHEIRKLMTNSNRWKCIQNINHIFREHLGQDAIIRTSLWKRRNRGGDFWVFSLNPEIFDVPERINLEPKKDVQISDLLSTRFKVILLYVRDHPFCSFKELCKIFKTRDVKEFRSYVKPENLHPAIDLQLPIPILRSATFPRIYWVNPKFAEVYQFSLPGIDIYSRPIDQIFKQRDLELLRAFAKYPSTTAVFVLEGRNRLRVHEEIHSINRRCEELGLPKAIILIKSSKKSREFKMSDAFKKKFGLDYIEQQYKLENHFSLAQIKVISYLVEHPLARPQEIAEALKVSKSMIWKTIKEISFNCRKLKVQPIETTARNFAAFYLTDEFLEIFNLPKKTWSPERLFAGEKQKRLYQYLQENPQSSLSRAAKALGISRGAVSQSLFEINKKLKKFGFQSLRFL